LKLKSFMEIFDFIAEMPLEISIWDWIYNSS
jgi:hypothetical protein